MATNKNRGVKRSWITPCLDFATESHGNSVKAKPRSRSTLAQSKALVSYSKSAPSFQLWVDKHAPKSKSDLAVHHKKVLEVEEWFVKLCNASGSQESCILLLTGPSGAGKTATVQVLAKQHNVELKEWVNPLGGEKMYGAHETGYQESQGQLFWDFILRATRYPSLNIVGEVCSKRVILVEDFPNVFVKSPSEFHQLLRKFHGRNNCSVIFVVSDNNKSLNVKDLFPADLQNELNIRHISFNPVSPTSLLKVLTRVAQSEVSAPPTKTTLQSLILLISGDIRLALNTLQFSYSDIKTKRPESNSTKGKKKTTEKDQEGPARDTVLFIFHALGKILHCKRDTDQPTDAKDLPQFLQSHSRHPLLNEPEEIIRNASLSSETMILFVHQNCLSFCHDIGEAVEAAAYFSDADTLVTDWTGRNALEECSGLVGIRGFMHSLQSTKSAGWQPIHKPYWYTANTLIRTRKTAIRHLGSESAILQEKLLTEILPYRHKICTSGNSKEHAVLLKELCTFPVNRFARKYEEKLGEREVLLEEENDNGDGVPKQDLTSVLVGPCSDDELVIEEFPEEMFRG